MAGETIRGVDMLDYLRIRRTTIQQEMKAHESQLSALGREKAEIDRALRSSAIDTRENNR